MSLLKQGPSRNDYLCPKYPLISPSGNEGLLNPDLCESEISNLDHLETTMKSGELYYIFATTIPNHPVPDSIECFRPATLWNGEFEKNWYQKLEGKTYKRPVNLVHYYSLPTTKQVLTRRTTRRIITDDRVKDEVYDEKWERFAKLMEYDDLLEERKETGKHGKKERRKREAHDSRNENSENASDDVDKIEDMEREVSQKLAAVIGNYGVKETVKIPSLITVGNWENINKSDEENIGQTSQQKGTERVKGNYTSANSSTHRHHRLVFHIEDLVNFKPSNLDLSDREFMNATTDILSYQKYPNFSRNKFENDWYKGRSNISTEAKHSLGTNEKVGKLIIQIPVQHGKVETVVGSPLINCRNKTYQVDILIQKNKPSGQSNVTDNITETRHTSTTVNTSNVTSSEKSTALFNNTTTNTASVPVNTFENAKRNDMTQHISLIEKLTKKLDKDLDNVLTSDETQKIDEELAKINESLVEAFLKTRVANKGHLKVIDFFLNKKTNIDNTLIYNVTHHTIKDFITTNIELTETTLVAQETVPKQIHDRLSKVINFYLNYQNGEKTSHNLVKRNVNLNAKDINAEPHENDPEKPCIQNVNRAKFYKFLKMVHVNVSNTRDSRDQIDDNIVNDKTTKFSLGNCKKYFLLPLDYDYNRLVKD